MQDAEHYLVYRDPQNEGFPLLSLTVVAAPCYAPRSF